MDMALEYADESFKKDKSIVLAAIKTRWRSIIVCR